MQGIVTIQLYTNNRLYEVGSPLRSSPDPVNRYFLKPMHITEAERDLESKGYTIGETALLKMGRPLLSTIQLYF